jgi:LuxR family maltose regulon positive regulatory protein
MNVSLLYHQERFLEVIDTLAGSLGGIKQKGLERLWLKLLLIQALALRAVGREGQALEALEQCLAAAEAEGYIRIFVERGAPMASLLEAAGSRGMHPEAISKLLTAFHLPAGSPEPDQPAPAASGSPGAGLVEPLSGRELEVLRLLNSHLAVPEIAREMMVAPSTLRTHVRNIYLKLDVHGRLEALKKARDLGLL